MIDNLRATIELMAKTRIAIKNSDTFSMAAWYNPCGTPACWAGHAFCETGSSISIKEFFFANDPAEMLHKSIFKGIPLIALRYLVLEDEMPIKVFWDLNFSSIPYDEVLEIYEDVWDENNIEIRSREKQLKLVTLYENYLRRKLAILECETNEWGKQKRAKDVPVGQERQAILNSVELVEQV